VKIAGEHFNMNNAVIDRTDDNSRNSAGDTTPGELPGSADCTYCEATANLADTTLAKASHASHVADTGDTTDTTVKIDSAACYAAVSPNVDALVDTESPSEALYSGFVERIDVVQLSLANFDTIFIQLACQNRAQWEEVKRAATDLKGLSLYARALLSVCLASERNPRV
jgi:hypothetical protein